MKQITFETYFLLITTFKFSAKLRNAFLRFTYSLASFAIHHTSPSKRLEVVQPWLLPIPTCFVIKAIRYFFTNVLCGFGVYVELILIVYHQWHAEKIFFLFTRLLLWRIIGSKSGLWSHFSFSNDYRPLFIACDIM